MKTLEEKTNPVLEIFVYDEFEVNPEPPKVQYVFSVPQPQDYITIMVSPDYFTNGTSPRAPSMDIFNWYNLEATSMVAF